MAAKRNATNEALMQAARASIAMLQRPDVQEQIKNAASSISSRMKARNQERADRKAAEPPPAERRPAVAGETPSARRSPTNALTSPFGQKKLGRRIEKLRENVSLLRDAVDPTAAAALGEVDAVVNRLEVAVTMAGNLPITKRQKAYREIDSVLDELEKGVFATVME